MSETMTDELSSATDYEILTECERREIVAVGFSQDALTEWEDMTDKLRAAQGTLHFEVVLLEMMALAGMPKRKHSKLKE